MDWEPVIGLELHVQLNTVSKIFSGASTRFGQPPNSQACPVDLGLPGVLPVLNEAAVKKAVQFGLAIGARINHRSRFDRKNYFYPDLPKGYQISQFEAPIVGAGTVTIDLADGEQRTVRITRAHLEEDAGKSIHDVFPGQTGIDLNRAGTPLLEVVSEPDLRSAAEAATLFRTLHALVRYLGICDGNMAEGNIRCDANVSIRPKGTTSLGERTELKNINSFRFVERAIELEIQRQIQVLESGGTIHRETRLFDAERQETRSMRSKEASEDYRYFPDPDLLPLEIDESFIQSLRDAMPELPDARRLRFEQDLGLSHYDAGWLTADPDIADFFESALLISAEPKLTANWVMGDLSGALNRYDLDIARSPIPATALGQLIARIEDRTLSGKMAKSVFDALWDSAPSVSAGADEVDKIITTRGLVQMSDASELGAIIDAIVAGHPDQVAQFRAGKTKVRGFFVGQVMQQTKGQADPAQVNRLLDKALSG